MSSDTPRLRGLGTIGAWCASHPLIVIAGWLLLLVGTQAAATATGGAVDDSVDLPGSQVREAADLLEESGGIGSGSQIVVHVTENAVADVAPGPAAPRPGINDGDGPRYLVDPPLAGPDPPSRRARAAATLGGSTTTPTPAPVTSLARPTES